MKIGRTTRSGLWACGVALACGWTAAGDPTAPQRTPPSPAAAPAPLAGSPQAPVASELDAVVIGVSRDGAWALLAHGYPGFQHPGTYRRVALPSGADLGGAPPSTLAQLPVDGLIDDASRRAWQPPAGLGPALAQVGAQWSALAETHHARFAASAHGVVFGVGDGLYVGDAAGTRWRPLSRSAAQAPEMSPDGRTVAWGEHVGRVPGRAGNYALHFAALPDARAVVRVAGADEVDYARTRFSADGRWLYFLAHDPVRRQQCLRRAPVTTPRSQATSVLCGAAEPRDIDVAFAPSRGLALVATRSRRTPRDAGMVHLAWVRLADGAVLERHTRSGVFVLHGVMDDGLVLAAVGLETHLFDPARRATVALPSLRLPPHLYAAAWRNADELVVSTRRATHLVRPRALFDQGAAAPW